MGDILHFLLSEFSENSTYGISTHILFNFPITEIKNTKPSQNHQKSFGNLFGNLLNLQQKSTLHHP